VVDTLKVVTEEVITTTTTVTEKHKLNVPETMTEILDVSDEEGEDTMTGDGGEYLRAEDLRELGDDSLPGHYLDSFSYMNLLIVDISTHVIKVALCCLASVASVALNIAFIIFLVSFMVDARGGAMRGCRHNGLRIIVPPRKCSAPTRVTCRLVKRHRLASMPPMVEGEGLAGRIIEVGPTGAQFLGPVIVEIPHFAALRGTERELVILRSETGESWKEHHCDFTEEELNQILNGMDEKLDSPEELEKKRICRIITRDFPQYFAVVSRIKQDSHLIGPEGGVLSSTLVPQVQAVFPEGALTKKIRVGLQAQPIDVEMVRKILGNKATFSPIVTLEPRRRKFHKPITMTIPIPKSSNSDGSGAMFSGETPTLRLLCSITGGTTPAQWEDITGSTPLTFVNQCVSFTTNVSARFWLIDCRQIQESVSFGSQLYREIICVPYMAKFVIFAKTLDPIEARLRCFCMTDDKMDKTLEQQENFTEVARSRDVEVLEGKPIFADCFGNLVPLTKSGQHHVFSFFAFKENRLALFIKIRDTAQEPCGRLSFTKEPRTYRSLNHNAICNLNITLPTYSKVRSNLSQLDDADRKEETLAIIADLLGFSWTELARELEFSEDDIQLVRTENPNSLQEQSHALLQRWVEREGKHATEDCLIKRLTKINRMDIVHLIETQMNKSVQEQTSRTYAEIEKTLDHSEGSKSSKHFTPGSIYSFESLKAGMSSFVQLAEDTQTNVAATQPAHFHQVEPEVVTVSCDITSETSVISSIDIHKDSPVSPTESFSIPESPQNLCEEMEPTIHDDMFQSSRTDGNATETLPSGAAMSQHDILEKNLTNLCQEDSTTDADEMPDLPTQSVTEEKYRDENGHMVVKKVTRKVIRKCVSVDGVEHEEMTLEGASQGSVTLPGDGYSKVVKRTVLKSDGDHTEDNNGGGRKNNDTPR
uniref:Ankyrin 2a, neuronal n=1 Tax=Amphiprion percula TaxID=161767 RepID=A0A3P8TWV0_AMPPE